MEECKDQMGDETLADIVELASMNDKGFEIKDLQFDSKGRLITASHSPADKKNKISLYTTDGSKISLDKFVELPEDPITRIAVSRSGFVVFSQGNELKAIEPDNSAKKYVLKGPAKDYLPIADMEFINKEQGLVIARGTDLIFYELRPGWARLPNMISETSRYSMPSNIDSFHMINGNPMKMLVTCYDEVDNFIEHQIYVAEFDGKNLKIRENPIQRGGGFVRVNPQNTLFVTRAWMNIQVGELVGDLVFGCRVKDVPKNNNGTLQKAEFSPDGKYLVAAGNDMLVLYSVTYNPKK